MSYDIDIDMIVEVTIYQLSLHNSFYESTRTSLQPQRADSLPLLGYLSYSLNRPVEEVGVGM